MYNKFFKVFLDFTFALIGLLILSPVIIVLSILLYFFNKGEIFFLQKRPGKNEKIFNIIKFRTMTNAVDATGNLLPDDQRITKIGHWIRQLSLDESLQLINVLKGEMSLVGPRPLLVDYLGIYNDNHKKRHLVKPGITGWAQVNGRNHISWERKFDLDIMYVDRLSFWFDVKILYLTIKKVLLREAINSDTNVNVEPFKGYG